MAHIKPCVRNNLGREVDDDDILLVNALGFDDPEWVENRRGHVGSNVELLVGYFAEGDAYQISHAYKRGVRLGCDSRGPGFDRFLALQGPAWYPSNVDRAENFMRIWLAKSSDRCVRMASPVVARAVAESMAGWWLV